MVLVWATGCPADDINEAAETTGPTSGIDPSAPSSSSPTTEAESTGATPSTTTDTPADTGTTVDGSTGSDPSTTDGDSTGNNPLIPVDCGGTIYACGDMMDNDEDGLVDLLDPECTGPCDDDESSFQTGLPGDNMDCKQDCFFDGNSGQGDDGCIWDLRCDPEDPGADVGCGYTGGNNCNNLPPNQDPECVMFCEQYVPPGCDCFGCCEVQTADGPVHIFLNSGPDCALDNLDACQSCTYQIDDCGVPCLDDSCQVCFGQLEPDPDCDDPTCEIGEPCTDVSDCATDYYCLLGCCYPPPPG